MSHPFTGQWCPGPLGGMHGAECNTLCGCSPCLCHGAHTETQHPLDARTIVVVWNLNMGAQNSSELLHIFNALVMPIHHIKLQTSAPVTIEHVIDIINKYKARIREDAVIHQAYGQSEGAVLETKTEEPYCNIRTFDPIYEGKLRDPETGKDILEPNVVGELLVKGAIMAGYYHNPKATQEAFSDDGYFKTGDLFYKDENGLYYFVERLKMLLKYKNHQIDAATGEEETCASVLSRTIRLAQCFGKLGLVPGDPIVVGGRNHLDVHIPFYAGMMSGLPVAGIDPALKSIELKHFLGIVNPKLAFCEYAMLEEYQQAVQELNLNTQIVTFGGGENSLAKFMDQQNLPSEEEFQVATFNTDEVYCWLTSTSGSTGRPKVVALTHSHLRQMSDFLYSPANKNGLRKTALNLSTLHWASGSFNALLMPINHIKVQTSAPATTEHVIDIINKYKPAKTVCTPTFLAPLLHHRTDCDLTCFDLIYVGGSKVHKELLMRLRARLREDTVIMKGYGLTEVGGAVLLTPEGAPFGIMGTIEAKLISPDTGEEILEPNVTGELLLKGPVMACYYNDPTETKEVFTDDGYIKTGDLFYKDENGLFYFVERLKMLLKYKNYQIVPPDVEEVILTHNGVADVCVTGIPHPFDGEHVVACVVREQGSKVTAQEIKDLVSKHLSASKHLHGGVVFLDALPLTASGKVARMEVKKLVLTAYRELSE